MKMGYFRKIKVNGQIVVSDDSDITTKMIRKTLPKHLKRKELYWDSKTGNYYYLEEKVVGNAKFLGAYKDKECTIKKHIN